ncbi:DUF4097 family beta strand repeat-containing protein [Halalkalibacterium ligniniphilum]|uniref:DUF4097 family beta strand repeat-containing protein n=1 Tax=Halalkalibacterium ligniniphilum TaxID=1134413 RepID=UPI0003485E4C|nr:DUF4097 family beta strand repeat-containing protein [Halalkalibacterium ligniniphilum]
MKKVAGILLIGIGIILVLVNIPVIFSGWGKESSGGYAAELIDGKEHVFIRSTSLNLEVVPTAEEELTVQLEDTRNGEYELVKNSRGHRVEFEVREPSFRFFSFLFFRADPKVVVSIPESYQETLELRSVSGDIYINGNDRLKTLTIKTVSGDVLGERFFAEQLDFSSTSGDLFLNDVQTTNGKMDSTSGDVVVKTYQGNLMSKSVSGDILVTYQGENGDGRFETVSGDVRLTYPEPNFTLSTQTISGDILIQHSIQGSNQQSQSVSGTIGAGLYTVDVKTTSGDVIIN